MKCPHCGSQLLPDQKFCTQCGKSVSIGQEYSWDEDDAVPASISKTEKTKSWLIIGVLILAAAGIMGWFVTQNAFTHQTKAGNFPLADTLLGNETTIFVTVPENCTENDIPSELSVFSRGRVGRISLDHLSEEEQAAFSLSELSDKSNTEILALIEEYDQLCTTEFLLLVTTQDNAPDIIQIDDNSLTSPQWLAEPKSHLIAETEWNGFPVYEGSADSHALALCRKPAASLEIPDFSLNESFSHYPHVLVNPDTASLQKAYEELTTACQLPLRLASKEIEESSEDEESSQSESAEASSEAPSLPPAPVSITPSPETDFEAVVISEETPVSEQQPAGDSDSFIFAQSSNELLHSEDLQGLSLFDLYIARNEIFARHHRQFDNNDLKTWFNQKSWYSGTIPPDDFDLNVLSSIEKANIAFIREEEKRQGSPYLY